MTTAELTWGGTQFILNVVLIVSSLKIVHDISTYIKHSDRRFKAIYFKVCRAGERLTVFSSKLKQRKFRRLVAQLIELDPEVENPFVGTPYEWAAEEFKNVKEQYNTYHWKLWHQ
jgi:hypothetical protein